MRSIIFILYLLVSFSSLAQTDVFAINKKLGKGINMGNIFEAPKENEWGNPFKDDYFKRIKTLGFSHVRIPIRWDTPERCQQTSPYEISESFKSRIKYVVDLAMKENLLVIINMHHHDQIFVDPNGQKSKFLAQWNQISDLFKDYNNDLVFEVMNEPHDNLTPELWNTFFADALKEIRVKNSQRAVIMGTALYGGLSGLSSLKLPNDDKIIVSIHYYNPFQFTHQGAEWVANSEPWLGTTWNDTEIERQTVESEFSALVQFEKQNKVPINIGEFGTYSKADNKSRILWTTFMARYIESLGYSWAYWEWSAGFGIFNPSNNTYKQDLVDALISKKLPEPTETKLTQVYCSDFSKINDWTVFSQGGAISTSNVLDGNLSINITTKGSEAWHVQGTKPNLNISKGKTYRLSLEVKSSNNNSINFYVGKNNAPYNSYSGYNTAATTNEFKTFSSVFTMNDITDTKARLTLDMGLATGTIQVKSVCLEEVTLIFTNTNVVISSFEVSLKPNPVFESFTIDKLQNGDQLSIIDLQGKIIYEAKIESDNHSVSTVNWPQGQYYVIVIRGSSKQQLAFVKQ